MYEWNQYLRTEGDETFILDFPGTANVLLYTITEYESYVGGVPCTAEMAITQEAPVSIRPPRAGEWYVVVEIPVSVSCRRESATA